MPEEKNPSNMEVPQKNEEKKMTTQQDHPGSVGALSSPESPQSTADFPARLLSGAPHSEPAHVAILSAGKQMSS